jgi:hypothetical protein
MALTLIQQCRLAVADMDPAFPLLTDDSYEYFLEKNNDNVTRASLDAAKTILLILSQRGSETVDIFSVTGGHKSAEQYRLALQLFLKSPELNPLMTSATVYAGGISLSDMQANIDNSDNNTVKTANSRSISSLDNPFVI